MCEQKDCNSVLRRAEKLPGLRFAGEPEEMHVKSNPAFGGRDQKENKTMHVCLAQGPGDG